jgi:peptidoglycan/LPS O-acetylase OafA/YrhL
LLQAKNKLNLIQMLRGIASLLVVLYHATMNMPINFKMNFIGGWFYFGNGGVDIFFVLSGFIITYTSFKSIGNSKQFFPFLRRRFIRIFPSYWIIIGGFLAMQLLLPSFYGNGYVFSFSNLLSTAFLLPGHAMVNGVSWTLTYELFYYLLFSLAFLIPDKRISIFLAILYVCFLIALPVIGYNTDNNGQYWQIFAFPMNVEFFLGILSVALISRIPNSFALPLIIIGSLLFMIGGVLTDQHYWIVNNVFNRVIVFGIPSLMIITGIVKLELNKTRRVHNILLSLGEASYSLYLLHLPLVVAGMKVIARAGIENNFMLQLLVLLLIVVICFISIVFFNWVEKPIIKWLHR